MNSTANKILVTGGAGYIGSTLVNILLSKNKKVVVLDNFTFKNKNVFKKNKNLQVITGDITKVNDVKKAMKDVSMVVHLAGIVGDPACGINPKLTQKINVGGTRILVKESIKQNVQRFVFASSCSVYGFTEKIATERSKPNPVSLYSETKLISEKDILNEKDLSFHPTILRFSTIFGKSPRPRFDLAANIFTAEGYFKKEIKVNNGDQWRPFINVFDVAYAIYLVLEADIKIVDRQIFNVGDDSMVLTISNLAKKIKKILNNKDLKITKTEEFKDPRDYQVSFKKINNKLKFKKSVSFENGINELVKEFKKNNKYNYKNKKYNNAEMLRSNLKST